ncbi:hypothetical protein ATANTOWER_027817 [Ataeniobius toweri]|uniref:Uncharacterized protein n=1 Tax=Ataeniobius toweri TaxID=208326 RepID=A0ABU7AH80_9TELE|nr:hypothetical protein [Ataeniobius toweri]
MCLGTWSHDGRKSSGTARVQRDSDKMDIEEVRASQKGQNIGKLPSKETLVVRGPLLRWACTQRHMDSDCGP